MEQALDVEQALASYCRRKEKGKILFSAERAPRNIFVRPSDRPKNIFFGRASALMEGGAGRPPRTPPADFFAPSPISEFFDFGKLTRPPSLY